MSGPDGNLFEAVPALLPEEEIRPLAEGSGARIERIVSCGQASAARLLVRPGAPGMGGVACR